MRHALVALMTLMSQGCNDQTATMGPHMTRSNDNQAFTCGRAAELLGHPKATVKACDEVLPDLWRIGLTDGDFAPGWNELRTFVWRNGAIVNDRGQSTLARYLRSIKAHERPPISAFAVSVMLETLGATPPGFNPNDVNGQIDGLKGEVSHAPFGVTLIQSNYTPPQPSTSPPLPQGGLSKPPGGPPSGPSVGPPGGGASPPSVGRATLTLNASYVGEWTIEVRQRPGEPFSLRQQLPVAP